MIPNREILAGLIEGSPYPIYLILGDELIVAVANAATLKAWGKDKSVIGKTFSAALPELKDQPFEGLIRNVMLTGEAYHAVNDRATFLIDGKERVSYFTFAYQPFTDAEGHIIGVVCYATDVTGLVDSIEQIKSLSEQAIEANENLASTNKALEVSNEELATTNEELTESYHLLELSELRFRNLIQQAPFSICVIRAQDLIVTDVNDRYLEMVGKKRSQIDGLSIWEGVPEAAAAYAPVMQEVITSKQAYSAKEASLTLIRNGFPEQLFMDFTYEPVIDLSGKVSAIMVVGIDVSEKVNARKAIEEVEERIRLAIDAADIGTYEYRFDTDSLMTSDRFNEILGLGEVVNREQIYKYYHPEDLQLSTKAYEQAKETGKVVYEARYLHPDQPMKWLRYQAKLYMDADGNRKRTLGTVIDITEYKALQQQKDDFISIASHELKTPITSLKASLQLLNKMKDNPNPVLLPRLLDQATRNMDKIAELVDDLLNVSKMNQGQVALRKDWFRVMEMLEKSCSHVRQSSTHTLVLNGDPDLMIFADEHRIDQVVVNLVNNAIKYAPNSLNIYLAVEQVGEMAKISVRDTGPGVSPDKIPHLFDRYYRADNSGKQVSGLGLGLYISADLIQRHGGEIGVDSKLGAGSTFWFTIPVAAINEG
jgi:PAS domain S-box-containing protein